MFVYYQRKFVQIGGSEIFALSFFEEVNSHKKCFLFSLYCSEKCKLYIKKNYNNIISNFDINNLKFTDKTLLNFNWIGLIKLCYPNAKLINCYRNSKDNCISIYKNLFDHEGAWCYDEDNLVKYYKLYREMIDFWKKMIPGFIYDVKYEDLVNNPEVSIKKIIKYCNLDWEENCINFYKNKNAIKTLSVKQVRNSIYSSSINSFNKFEKFSKDLFKNL